MTTHGFVPTDLQSLCTECALLLISRMAAGTKEAVIDHSYFEQALKVVRPSGMSEFQSKVGCPCLLGWLGVHRLLKRI